MASRSLCVGDANIWIDLHYGGILREAFCLPFGWTTVDVVAEELQEVEPATLQAYGLSIIELPGEGVAEVVRMSGKYAQPSRTDLFALALAAWLQVPLITGDRHLRTAAQQEGVEVHGVLWLLDQMVELDIISPAGAAEALQRMLDSGSRLPSNEVYSRFRRWGRTL